MAAKKRVNQIGKNLGISFNSSQSLLYWRVGNLLSLETN